MLSTRKALKLTGYEMWLFWLKTKIMATGMSNHINCLLLYSLVFLFFFFFFFKNGNAGVLKPCLGYLNEGRSSQIFWNLAVNWGQIPRWSIRDFATSGHYFSSSKFPCFCKQMLSWLISGSELRTEVPDQSLLSVQHSRVTRWCWASTPPARGAAGAKETATSKSTVRMRNIRYEKILRKMSNTGSISRTLQYRGGCIFYMQTTATTTTLYLHDLPYASMLGYKLLEHRRWALFTTTYS